MKSKSLFNSKGIIIEGLLIVEPEIYLMKEDSFLKVGIKENLIV